MFDISTVLGVARTDAEALLLWDEETPKDAVGTYSTGLEKRFAA